MQCVFGVLQKKLNLEGKSEFFVGLACTVASLAIGMAFPLIGGKEAWTGFTFAYIFFASVLPMWLLKQPRDYMTTFMFAGMILGAVVGIVVAHPNMNLPMYTGFTNEKLGNMFPILFVTVACGAVSGFHSLVSSGTSSKTVDNEKDMLKVGYGAMVLESLLAVLALCVAGAAAAADGTAAVGTPFQIFSSGVAGLLEMFGLPIYVAQCFMTMCVSALALTSLDAVARIGRMSFQELFSVDDMENAEGWRKFLCNKYVSTIITLAFGYILTRVGYSNIWPSVRKRKPAVKRTCSDHTLRILKGNRQTEQDPDRTVRDHALRNLHSTGSENACSCKRIQRRYRSIYG